MKRRNRLPYLIPVIVANVLAVTSCSDYLAVKPDKKLATPTTPKDLQAILDMVGYVNDGNPGLGEVGCDNFFLSYTNWQSIPTSEDREIYTWERVPVNDGYWTRMYRKIYYANTVLDHLEQVSFTQEHEKRELYGQAAFVRGLAFHKLAEVFGVPYDPATAPNKPGVVLRTSSDINVRFDRSSLAGTYGRIIQDLEAAASNLGAHTPIYPTRPSRAAAYGALARCYLSMREYDKAGVYADSCLALKADLLDYNEFTEGQPYPFERYNAEVIYHSRLVAPRNLQESTARVDTLLYANYADDDLRKGLFFSLRDDGYHAFTGDYSRSATEKFDGITVAEMLLVRAECLARAGRFNDAETAMLTLLRNRYRDNNVADVGLPATAEDLVDRIIDERRKELIGRGLRWSDIRRLSFEDSRAVDLVRYHGDEFYGLSASQQREFAFFLPQSATELGNISQNE